MKYGVLFNRKSGKIIKTIESFSESLLKMYALNGTSPSRDFLIFDGDTGIVSFYCEGKKNDFPNICEDMVGKHINDFCDGLMDAIMHEVENDVGKE